MNCSIYNENDVCPKCGDLIRKDIDVGDGFLYDICYSCSFKKKKKLDGQVVEIAGRKVDLE